MRTLTLASSLVLAVACLFAATQDVGARAATRPATPTPRRLPAPSVSGGPKIVENRGQVEGDAAYYVLSRDKSVQFGDDGLVIDVRGASASWAVKADFVGASCAPRGEGVQATKLSWFKGPKSEWKTGVRTFSSVAYRDLWPGVDLVYEAAPTGLKYAFHVHAGADASAIRMRWSGASSVTVGADGRLSVATPAGSFDDGAPTSFQEKDGRRVAVASAWRVENGADGSATASFDLGAFDASRELVVDPFITAYSGFLGGNDSDDVYGVATDAAGNAYITGATFSSATTLPVTVGPSLFQHGYYDAFVAKVSPAGTILFCGYLGGGSPDFGYGVAVDSLGRVYVAGHTQSKGDFPTTAGTAQNGYGGGFGDAFLCRIAGDGTFLDWSTYLGGTGWDGALCVGVDSNFRVFVGGYTLAGMNVSGSPNPVNGTFNGFAMELAPNAVAVNYVNYYGASSFSGNTFVNAVAVDATGNAYFGGSSSTPSFAFPGTVGPKVVKSDGDEGFVTKLDQAGATVYCGFLGGVASGVRGVALGSSGELYCAGITGDTTGAQIVTAGGGDLAYNSGPQNAYYAKVKANGQALDYSCFFGSSSWANGVAVDADGVATIVGYADFDVPPVGPDFPAAVAGVGDSTSHGGRDGFIVQVDATGTPILGGWYGGSGEDNAVGVAVSSGGSVIVAGTTTSPATDFPLVVGPSATQHAASAKDVPDAFVARFLAGAAPTAPVQTAASTVTSTQITFQWQDTSSNETGFEIEHSTDGGANWTPAGVAPADASSYADTGLLPDRTYSSRVRAVNNVGPSAWSSVIATRTSSTFALTIKKNQKLVDSATALKDSFVIAGKAVPNLYAPLLPFDPATDDVTIVFGDVAAPQTLTILAGDPGWKKQGKKRTWKTVAGAKPAVVFSIDFTHKTFTFSQKKFDWPAAQTNPITFGFHTDREGATSTSAWTATATGFKSP